MFTKFIEAFRLLCQNFRLFAAIIFTVWVPGNLLINFISYNLPEVSESFLMRLPMLIETVFGPLYFGALVYALYQIKSGNPVSYREAMSIGSQKWGSLFLARFVAGFLTMLGLIAFIVPGLMLAVRYSLLDAAVIVEGKGARDSRVRSTELTKGRRWPIFWSALLFLMVFFSMSFALYLGFALVPLLDNMFAGTLLDCFLDLVFAIIQIVLFLFYWEATEGQRQAEADLSIHGDLSGHGETLQLNEGSRSMS